MNTLQRAIEIEKMIHEKVSKDIHVGVGIYSYTEGTKYIHMIHKNSKDAFNLHEMTDEMILEKAKELCEPSFTKISTVCMGLIGKEVWVNKEIPIVIDSIGRNDDGYNIVTSIDGKAYNADNLYIKE